MNNHLHKIAAGLALIVGVMAVAAGGQVLLGNTPTYNVISWLPAYNLAVGVLTVFPTALLIWNKNRWANSAGLATFSAHASVLLVLLTAYRQEVAPASLGAMSVRLAAWLVILALMFFQTRRGRTAGAPMR